MDRGDGGGEKEDRGLVKKASSAYMFYSRAVSATVRQELESENVGEPVAIGDVGRRVSELWKGLAPDERQVYVDMSAKDKERERLESLEADRRAEEEQRARREALSGPVDEFSQRKGRVRMDAVREERERRLEELAARRKERPVSEAELARREETRKRREGRAREEAKVASQHKQLKDTNARDAKRRLEYLLAQSDVFSKLKMGSTAADEGGAEGSEAAGGRGAATSSSSSSSSPRVGRPRVVDSPSKRSGRSFSAGHEVDDISDINDADSEAGNTVVLRSQPSTIVGGTMKDYQLEGLNWMIHLRSKGLNGILADEMGLGKTLQSISILGYQYSNLLVNGPHLVVVPKSTLSNWMNELKRWCPSLRAMRFHGNKEERAIFAEKVSGWAVGVGR